MISFELAKQLKDAGFPQKGYWFYSTNETDEPVLTTEAYVYGTENIVKTADGKGWEKVNLCFAPTLSELIEACGKGFWALFNENDGWWARKETPNGQDFKGQSPEEAVANLWLKLNQ